MRSRERLTLFAGMPVMKLKVLFTEKTLGQCICAKVLLAFKCKIEEVCLQHIFTSFLLQIEVHLLGAITT